MIVSEPAPVVMVSEPKVTLVCVMTALPEPVVIMLAPATTLVSVIMSVLVPGTGTTGKNGKNGKNGENGELLALVVVKEITPALVAMLFKVTVSTPGGVTIYTILSIKPML